MDLFLKLNKKKDLISVSDYLSLPEYKTALGEKIYDHDSVGYLATCQCSGQ